MHEFSLMSELGFPVVASSGNCADEPICTDENEAVEALKGLPIYSWSMTDRFRSAATIPSCTSCAGAQPCCAARAAMRRYRSWWGIVSPCRCSPSAVISKTP